MRIAVTGGLGFIGSALIKKLIKNGHDVVIIDNRNAQIPEGATLTITDITNNNQVLQALKNVDIVYHLAGTVLESSRKNLHSTISLDILGTTNVLESCVRNGVEKIIYASSFYVYDGLPASTHVDETQRSDIFKTEFFGTTKLIGERFIFEYNNRYDLKYVILRYGPVYGPNERCTCVVYDFIKNGLKNKPIIVWGYGKRKNQYTYIEDIAVGSILSLTETNEIFNLISPEQVSIRQIAELLSNTYGFKVKYDYNKSEGASLPYISPKKAIEKLSWKPVSLSEGIKRTINTLKNIYGL
jgi:nucleoside-diphosphate-sugar epimerase